MDRIPIYRPYNNFIVFTSSGWVADDGGPLLGITFDRDRMLKDLEIGMIIWKKHAQLMGWEPRTESGR